MSNTMNNKAADFRGELLALVIKSGVSVERVEQVMGHQEALGCINVMCQWLSNSGALAEESMAVWTGAARAFDKVTA